MTLLLIAPLLVAAVLAAVTSYVLRRGFRRSLSMPLAAALMTAFCHICLVASLDVHDGSQAKLFACGYISSHHCLQLVSGNPAGRSPALDVGLLSAWGSLTGAAALLIGSLILAGVAYRPRLQEYRYPGKGRYAS